MIFILDRQEKIIGTLKNSGANSGSAPYFDDTLTEDLLTGAETFQFSTIIDDKNSSLLSVGNFIAFKKDKKYKLFQILQTVEDHQESLFMTVYCECAGLELINKIIRKQTLTSVSVKRFMETVLQDTGWNVGLTPYDSDSLDIEIDNSSVYATIQNNISKYRMEIEFRVEINNGKISQKFIDIFENRGRVTGKRFEFGRNITGISRKTDSTNLYTALIGRGNNNISFKDVTVEGIDKPLGQDFVVDAEAYDRYNHNGYHIMGLYEFDTDSPEELLRETYKALKNCKEPRVEYEVEISVLEDEYNKDLSSLHIGDTVAIVDNFFNPPIHLAARVSKLETSETNLDSNKCTLSNFIEVKSNITDEMRKIAAELEGYVDSSIGKKFPIKEDDISEGAITAEKIYQNSITTDHLNADLVTAVTGRFETLEAETVKIDKLVTDVAQIDEAIINKADINQLQVAEAKIKDLESNTLKVSDLEASLGKFDQILAGNIEVDGQVSAAVGRFEAIETETAKIESLEVEVAKIESLEAEVGSFEKLVSDKVSTKDFEATNGRIETLESTAITTETLNAKLGEFDKVIAGEIEIEGQVSATAGKFQYIESEVAKISQIESDIISTNKLVANKVTASEVNSLIGNFQGLNAEQITSGSIDTEQLKANVISAINSYAGTMKIQQGQIETLQVGDANIIELDVSKLTGDKISADLINVEDLVVTEANIKELSANKIKGGTLDISKLDVASASGNLTIKDNTIQIKDNQESPKVRVQIGKDSTNNYGIVITNAEGKAIFDSDKGVLIPEGLGKNVVSEDKIVKGAVGVEKLNIEELFVSGNAFMNELNALEIKASNIKVDTVRNDLINFQGVVNFEALDDSLKGLMTEPYEVNEDGSYKLDENGNKIKTKTYINGGSILTNSITAEKMDIKGLTVFGPDNTPTFSVSQDGTVMIDAMLKSENFDINKNTGYQVTTDGRAIFNQAEIRGSVILPNAGITNSENSNVRFWAGTSYENRSNAPFRVNQDGSVFAMNGTYEGILKGRLDSGDVQIYKNALTIHYPDTEDEVIRLDSNKSNFNTDFSLGYDKLLFSNGNNTLKIDKTKIEWRPKTGGQTDISLNPETGIYNGLNFSSSAGGKQVIRYSNNDEKQGTLMFDSEGNQGQFGDFSFTRKNYSEDVKVNVDGELVVKSKIKGSSNNMEMRMTTDGFAFYAI